MLKKAIIVLALPLALAVNGCTRGEAQDAGQAEAPRLTNVEVEKVQLTDLSEFIIVPAYSEAVNDVILASEQGGKLLELMVDKGDMVRKGQVLARVGSDVYEAQLKEAEANLTLKQAALKKALALFERGSISGMQRLQAQVEHDAAEANVDLARVRLDRSILRAPFDGKIDERKVDQGEMVPMGGEVFRVVDPSRMKLESELSERDVTAVDKEEGITAEVEFDSYPDTTFHARLLFVATTATPASRTYPCEFMLDNRGGLIRGGMHARIKILKAEYRNVVVLPQTALVETENGRNVFVLDGEKAARREVKVGASNEGRVVVSTGVNSGDKVIVTGQRDLVDGQQVRVTAEKN